jgi:ComF family protein
LRTAILRTKQENGEWLAEELGRTFAGTRRGKLLSGSPEVIVPVPLHWRRRWHRGYNQAEAVARELARALNCPLRPGWLVRTRPTNLQPTLTPSARWENVRGAFRARSPDSIRGVRILLVDDVLTTGATADAAAAALLQAKAAQVTVAILAHR